MTRQIEERHIDSLEPWGSNARTHSDEQIAQIARSLREFGWTNPVLIDDQDRILAGHGRVAAARSIGMHIVPCLRLEYLDEDQKRAYVLADNQLALKAGWDHELLRGELLDLRDIGFDLELIGFDEIDVDAIFSGEAGGKNDSDGVPDEYRLSIVSKDEAEILAVKKLLGISASAAKVPADRVIGALQR
jgi:ParB-like chromosome segregation protein Spo0J